MFSSCLICGGSNCRESADHPRIDATAARQVALKASFDHKELQELKDEVSGFYLALGRCFQKVIEEENEKMQ